MKKIIILAALVAAFASQAETVTRCKTSLSGMVVCTTTEE